MKREGVFPHRDLQCYIANPLFLSFVLACLDLGFVKLTFYQTIMMMRGAFDQPGRLKIQPDKPRRGLLHFLYRIPDRLNETHRTRSTAFNAIQLPHSPPDLPPAPLRTRSRSNAILNSSFSARPSSSLFRAPLRSSSLASRSALSLRSSSRSRWIHRC